MYTFDILATFDKYQQAMKSVSMEKILFLKLKFISRRPVPNLSSFKNLLKIRNDILIGIIFDISFPSLHYCNNYGNPLKKSLLRSICLTIPSTPTISF